MNHLYRTVWNEVTRSFVAVAETVRSRGKRTTSRCATRATAASAPNESRRLPLPCIRPLALEQRFMFDGAAIADAAHALPDAAAKALIPDAPTPVQVRAADPSQNGGKKEVSFVDTSVADYKTLEAGIRAGVEIQEIDGSKSGLAQIAKWAETHTGYDAIHLMSHGNEATLRLGSDTLTNDSLFAPVVQAELAEIGHAMKSGGDLLLYGCDIAKGADGQAFVDALAGSVGCDVAASNDATGAAGLGGNWALEIEKGSIESAVIVDAQRAAGFAWLLATPSDKNFESNNNSNNSATSLVVDGITYASNGIATPDVIDDLIAYFGENITGFSGKGLVSDFAGSADTGISQFEFGTSDGSNFKLVSLAGNAYDTSASFAQNFDIVGYDGGSSGTEVVRVSGFNFQASGSYGSGNAAIAYTRNSANYGAGVLSFGTSWNQIDTVRFIRAAGETRGVCITLDNIDFSDPVAANTAPTFTATGTTLNIAQNASATDFASLVHASDSDASQTETWTQAAAPSHGSLTITGATANSGSADITPGGMLTYTPTTGFAGSDSFQIQVSDGTASTTRTISVNVTPAAPGTPALAAASDRGTYNNDNVTNAASLDLSGTSAAGDSASTVRVFLDKTANGSYDAGTDPTATATLSNGSWSVTGLSTSGVSDGTYNIYAVVTSATGSLTSALSGARSIALDKTAPAITFSNLAFSNDTGTSGSDFITNTASQTITATLSGTPAGTDVVYGSLDNGATWADITSKVSGTALTWNGVTLSGSGTLQIKVTDLAGNDGTVKSQAYTLDTAAPTASVTAATQTNSTSVTTAQSTETGKAYLVAASVTVTDMASLDNAVTAGTAKATTVAAANTNTTIAATGLADGSYYVYTVDAAGNVSAHSANAITLDSTAPTAGTPVAADLSAPGGTSFSFTVAYADAGAGIDTATFGTGNVTVKDPSNNALTVTGISASGNTVTYTVTPPGGSWDTSDAGTYTIGINGGSVKDLAGNAVAAAASAKTFAVSFDPAPVCGTNPAIGGGTTVGGTAFTTTNGSWTDATAGGDTIGYSYQWQSASDNAGTGAANIVGATNSSYTATTAEAHQYVRAMVTASDGHGNTPTAATAWTLVTDSAPANTAVPTISGTTTVGSQLAAGSGTWSDADGDSVTYSYQWYRADDASGTNEVAINGATAATYTLASSDAHKFVKVVVTADDGHGSSTVTAASTRSAIANTAPANAALPAITGTMTVGSQLAAGSGTWTDADADTVGYSYQWYRADDANGTNEAAISGATAATYTLASSDAHKFVKVVVTADDGHGSSDQTAATTRSAVANSAPANDVVPAVSGTHTVNNQLTADHGTWSDADADTLTYSYQWYRADDASRSNEAAIAGATANSYTLVSADNTKYVYVKVIAGDGTATAAAYSTPALVVNNASPANSIAPTIGGGTTVGGGAFSTDTGTWSDPDSDPVTYSYQWQSASDNAGTGAANIVGATNSSYTATTAEAHQYVRAVVTASDGHGNTPTAATAWTLVTDSPPGNTAVPTISGTTTVGSQLTAGSGTWSDADGDTLTYSYQWYRADDANGTNEAAINGATASAYTLTTADAHKFVKVAVTADDGHGSNTQTAISTRSAIADTAPVNAAVPTINGTTTVGSQLTASSGTWTDADSDTLTYSYQWYRADDAGGTNEAAISGATASAYTLATADAHKFVKVVVTADDGHGSNTVTAATTRSVIANTAPNNSVVPSIGGTTTVGSQLTAGSGSWSDADGDTLTYSYQWYRADDASGTNEAMIAGATANTYVSTSSDLNKHVKVLVTADDGRSTRTAASTYTAALVPPPLPPTTAMSTPPTAAPTPEPPAVPITAPTTTTIVFVSETSSVSAPTLANLNAIGTMTPPAPITVPAFPAPGATRPVSEAPPREAAFVLTQPPNPSGFQAVVIPKADGAADTLVVNRGMPDTILEPAARTEIAIPADAFAHTDPNAIVQLQAAQMNGQPLPAWVSFDAASGKFKVQPPAGASGELYIKVVARDAQGREAVATFRIVVGHEQSQDVGRGQGRDTGIRPGPQGRTSLSEQLRLTRHPPVLAEHLAALSRSAQAASRVRA